MSALTTHTITIWKRNKKQQRKDTSSTSDQKPNTRQKQDHLRAKLVPTPHRGGKKGSTPSVHKEQNHQGNKPKELPLNTCKLMETPPEQMQAPPEPMLNISQNFSPKMHTIKRITAHTGQTGTPHRSDRWPFWEPSTPVRAVSTPVRPVTKEKFQLLKMHSKLYEQLLNVCSKLFHAQTSPPCWQCMNQAENAKMQL